MKKPLTREEQLDKVKECAEALDAMDVPKDEREGFIMLPDWATKEMVFAGAYGASKTTLMKYKEKSMTKIYEMTKAFSGLKAGDKLEVESPKGELTKFVETMVGEKKKLVPRSCVKELGVKGHPPEITEETVAAVSAAMGDGDADELLAELGIGVKVTDASEGDKAEPPPKPKAKKVKLKKGQFYMSKITGGRLPTSGIDHVMWKVDEKWSKDMTKDIPEFDKEYVWQPDLLESMWIAWQLGKKMLLSGWPGTGKTSAVQQFCAIIGQPYMRFNGKDGIEASSFLGYPWATKGGMEWKDGLLPQGVAKGYMVSIDEVFKIPPGIQMAMQGLYEEGGYLTLDDKPGTADDKMVQPHKMFRMFMTDNVKGTGDSFDKFAATQVQDSSTLDRFGITATVEYMDKKDETNMLKGKYPEMDEKIVGELVKFANLVRRGYAKSEISLTLSPRGLQTICEVLEIVPDLPRAIQMAYTDKLGEQDEVDAVREMMRTVWR